ncbi:MAG: T9SS type A sorting domain-containing protein [Flavobacteriales bacterium]|nr:T9SS type A sorting domain-containing protein [Flavobacteriales bacterium]
MDARVTDMVWSHAGMVLSCDFGAPPFHPPYTGSIIRLTSSGEFVDEHGLAPILASTTPKVVLASSDGRVHVIGNYSQHTDSLCGFFHYGCSPDGSIQDSSFILSPNARQSYMENAAYGDDGTIMVGGSIGYTDEETCKYTQLLKLSEAGTVLADYTFGMSGVHLQYTRDIIPYADGLLVTTEEYPGVPGRYHQFSSSLELLAHWPGQAPHPDQLHPLDSILKGAMTLLALDEGSFIVGGAFKFPNEQYSSAVYLVRPDHSTSKVFVPHSAYYHDHSALFETIAAIDSNTFYFLSWENIHLWGQWLPYEPIGPDVLHVYKLDHDLNVLCDFILDGSTDSTYYIPTRIKTTPEGGFAILGSKKDMTDPNATMQAWVQTFSASDCALGVEALEAYSTALVYPNPGNSGFEVAVNWPRLVAGRITLFDVRGTQVAEAGIYGSTGRLDCAPLPQGLYLYRITDRSGHTVRSGRWVKE